MDNTERVARPDVSRRSFLAAMGVTAAAGAVAGVAGDALFSGRPASAAGTFVVPSEDVPHKRTWMAWPSSTSIWGTSLLPKIQGDIAKLAKEVAKYEPVILCADGSTNAANARAAVGSTVQVISSIPVNDCWMRDSGPLFRVNGAGGRDAIGLNFNGWGNKQTSSKDRYVAQRAASYAGVSPFTPAYVTGEGGGVEYDGDGTLFATETCWVNSNRNPGWTRKEIEDELLYMFGATKMIWCPGYLDPNDITDDHIDATARFVRPGVVMAQLPPAGATGPWATNARAIHDTLVNATDAKGRRLQVLTLENPDVLPRWPRNRWDTFLNSYVNWTVTNSTVITTQFGDTAKDAAAKAAIGAAFPGKTVVQLNLDQLYGEGGGGAHCVTMQEPLG
ncbi:agmatine deiminase family protein [Longispora sp. K20-0274]|uniref:agmatine deiminase family protein n=1 Tax=Longispora sp. K20-0274 TaxID=3088255 RepID=UPI00399BAC85